MKYDQLNTNLTEKEISLPSTAQTSVDIPLPSEYRAINITTITNPASNTSFGWMLPMHLTKSQIESAAKENNSNTLFRTGQCFVADGTTYYVAAFIHIKSTKLITVTGLFQGSNRVADILVRAFYY